ncbi:MAG: alpha,alpha-trehalase TreF [Woeseiaceae bacterium]|nr:alpha,alpha-trehalase TreF [Woeseiaceae bacterium]
MTHSLTPREIFGELFEAVQADRIFGDSKSFVDAVALRDPAEILRLYREERGRPRFDLQAFVRRHFDLPETRPDAAAMSASDDVRKQIENLWPKLTRTADRKTAYSSLIELPKPYVVPGGRFRELYYWDSYFTMLGLAASGQHGLLRDMVDNFAYLIDHIGFIPNGTRSYYCTRSQPPFFVLMIELLATSTNDESVYEHYFPQLKKEYEFWMAGSDGLSAAQPARRRVVRVGDTLLNRYWDEAAEPRQESYAEDIALASAADRDPAGLYRDIRAACESGWDFSSRWFDRTQTISSICTTGILPVDLNSIMHRIETMLGDISDRAGDAAGASHYRDRASSRKRTIQSLFFDSGAGFFFDIAIDSGKPTGTRSLAAAYPLFFGLATAEQGARVAARLDAEFLKPGGWVTTPFVTGQQWDSPNGWAPLHWIVCEGLRNYGLDDQAQEGAGRWIATNIDMYRKSGRFMEKYNVVEPGLAASGGEYAVQDGFGWTNGVLLSLLGKP